MSPVALVDYFPEDFKVSCSSETAIKLKVLEIPFDLTLDTTTPEDTLVRYRATSHFFNFVIHCGILPIDTDHSRTKISIHLELQEKVNPLILPLVRKKFTELIIHMNRSFVTKHLKKSI